MAHTLVLPKLGLTMTEGTIVEWLKREGDPIAVGEAIYEIETDKLTNLVESNVEGYLLKIVVPQGSTVPCLTPVGYVGQQGEEVPVEAISGEVETVSPLVETSSEERIATKPSGERIKASPAAKKLAKEHQIELSQITAGNPQKGISLSDVEEFLKKSTVLASGLAKKIAKDKEIDLQDIPVDGRIMSADVLAYSAEIKGEELEEVRPMNGMRKIIAKRMTESRQISPEVTFDISIDMSAMKEAKEDFFKNGLKVSYTDLLVSIVSRMLMKYPLLNCSVDGENIILKKYVNMGIAVALEDGLLVPVVKNAHLKGLEEISSEIKSLAASARNGTLGSDSLQGGTFTITNLGTYGIESFTPIINQPEVAILGVNTMKDTVVVCDGEMVIKPIMKLSLVADHRAVDGAVAAQFLAKLKQVLEKPAALLL